MFPDHNAKLAMVSPTGYGVRSDTEGQGYFRAKRGNRLHNGTDYICKPGQEIIAPIHGKIIRTAYPYSKDKQYEGCVIENPFLTIKMFYLKLFKNMVGEEIQQGDKIGTAQDISKKYSRQMQPHIHLEITEIDPNIFVRA